MVRAAVQRLLDLLVVLLGVSLLVFLMIRLIPGDAVAIMLGANSEVTPEAMAALRARVGLDQSMPVQYVTWLAKVLTGDLGTSLWTGRPISGEIADHLAPTVELTVLALVFGITLSVPIGCLMAVARGKAADVVMRIASIAGLTIPSFWLGLVLILVASVVAPAWQTLGFTPIGEDLLGNLAQVALPAFVLALPIVANQSRLVRSAMLDALGQDYIRTARAKGASEWRVVMKHGLRNALIPFITSVGITAGTLISGSIVVEQVFAIPGLGRLVLGGIAERNYPLVQATILVMTSAFVVVNFVVDLLYAFIDPRLRRAEG
jgi:peptide/nickel transport system permease protein